MDDRPSGLCAAFAWNRGGKIRACVPGAALPAPRLAEDLFFRELKGLAAFALSDSTAALFLLRSTPIDKRVCALLGRKDPCAGAACLEFLAVAGLRRRVVFELECPRYVPAALPTLFSLSNAIPSSLSTPSSIERVCITRGELRPVTRVWADMGRIRLDTCDSAAVGGGRARAV